jgi:hypothetical protein
MQNTLKINIFALCLALTPNIHSQSILSHDFEQIPQSDKIKNISQEAVIPSESALAAAVNQTGKAGVQALQFPQMPSAGIKQGPFGAYYTRLYFDKGWESVWKTGDYPDVAVRFPDTPVKCVFWRGTGYIPAIVSENNTWMTDKPIQSLLPLARSWNYAPALNLKTGGGYENKGYDVYQRAYRITRKDAKGGLDFIVQASESSPIENLALIIENWNNAEAKVSVNGKKSIQGKDYETGYIQGLEENKMIVWIYLKSTKPVSITILNTPK